MIKKHVCLEEMNNLPFTCFLLLDYCKGKSIGDLPEFRYFYKGQLKKTLDVEESSTPELFVDFLVEKGGSKKDEL